MKYVAKKLIWAASCCLFGLVVGIGFLYATQDFYPDSIAVVFIAMIVSIFASRSLKIGAFISDFGLAIFLAMVFPSNDSLIENPSIPILYTVQVITLINSGWATLNGLMLYLNPQFACEATKGRVAWDIAKTVNFYGTDLGKSPEDYQVTAVIPNGTADSFAPKPNAVCMISITRGGYTTRRYRVVTSSQGYSWSDVSSEAD